MSSQPAQSTAENAQQPPTPAWVSGPVDIRSVSLTGILVLMVMYTLYLAAPLFMPLTVAFLMSLLLAPLVRGGKAIKLPPPITAAFVLLGLMALFMTAVYQLAGPAAQWIQRAPQELSKLEQKLPIAQVQSAKRQMKEAAPGVDSGGESQSSMPFSPIEWLLTSTWTVAYGVGVSVIFMYFLLASGDTFLRKLVRVLPQYEDKRAAVETVQEIQTSVAKFLVTITLINICLGTAAATLLYLVGMPNPLLFGAMVGLFNFAPYIGPLAALAIIAFVALLSFDDATRVILAPALVLGLNILEGQFIQPTVAGRRLALSPVAVFVAIIVWGWMWGMVGILIAVPLLASFKLVCDRVESLHPIAEFLGS